MEFSYINCWECKRYNYFGLLQNCLAVFYKVKHTTIQWWVIPPQEKLTLHSQTFTKTTKMFIVVLFITAKNWEQPKCLPTGKWINWCIHTSMEYNVFHCILKWAKQFLLAWEKNPNQENFFKWTCACPICYYFHVNQVFAVCPYYQVVELLYSSVSHEAGTATFCLQCLQQIIQRGQTHGFVVYFQMSLCLDDLELKKGVCFRIGEKLLLWHKAHPGTIPTSVID